MKRMTRTRPDDAAQALLPLKPLEFSILVALAEGESYGYGIVKRIGERSGGGVRLAPGNLYQVLDRLINAGLIEPVEVEDEERRRWYGLTAFGRRVAAAEAGRLRELMETVESLHLLPEAGR
jgi:DNA-binding PadR family transcriptional regulator